MFERLLDRAHRSALARAQLRRRELAGALRQELPHGVSVQEVEAGLALTGRRLARRYEREPQLRWLLAELLR